MTINKTPKTTTTTMIISTVPAHNTMSCQRRLLPRLQRQRFPINYATFSRPGGAHAFSSPLATPMLGAQDHPNLKVIHGANRHPMSGLLFDFYRPPLVSVTVVKIHVFDMASCFVMGRSSIGQTHVQQGVFLVLLERTVPYDFNKTTDITRIKFPSLCTLRWYETNCTIALLI